MLEQGYYWCQIVHEYHPRLGSGPEFCIAVLSDKAERFDSSFLPQSNATPPGQGGGDITLRSNLYRNEEDEKLLQAVLRKRRRFDLSLIQSSGSVPVQFQFQFQFSSSSVQLPVSSSSSSFSSVKFSSSSSSASSSVPVQFQFRFGSEFSSSSSSSSGSSSVPERFSSVPVRFSSSSGSSSVRFSSVQFRLQLQLQLSSSSSSVQFSSVQFSSVPAPVQLQFSSSSSSGSSSSSSSSSSSVPSLLLQRTRRRRLPCPCSCKCEEESAQSSVTKMEDPTLPEVYSSAAARTVPTTVKACWSRPGKTPEAGVKEAAQLSFISGPILNAPLDCFTSILRWTCSRTRFARRRCQAPTGAPSRSRRRPEAPTLPFPSFSQKLSYGSGCSAGQVSCADEIHLSGRGGEQCDTLRFSATGKVVSLISSSGVEARREACCQTPRSTAIPHRRHQSI